MVNIGGLYRLLLSRPTAGLQVRRGLQEWMQGRELSGLWATLGRPSQPWVPLEEVSKTSTPAGKAALTPATVKSQESPLPAPPAQLNFESEDEGRVRGQKRPCQLSPPSSSSSSSTTRGGVGGAP